MSSSSIFLPLLFSVLVCSTFVGLSQARLSVTYPGIGRFHVGEFQHPINRPLADYKLPDTPEFISPTFYLYTRSNPSANITLRWNNTHDIGNSHYFNASHPVKVLLHGYVHCETEVLQDDDSWMFRLKDAMLAFQEMNVIIVDWRPGNRWPYDRATVNTRVVGPMVAIQIQAIVREKGAPLEAFHLIGQSLGAHIAGYAGKFLRREHAGKLGMITGLDAAKANFEGVAEDGRLCHSDAAYVEAIHTDATGSGEGAIEPYATVDIYPNGGHSQPGCEVSAFVAFTNAISFSRSRCDTRRAAEFYIESWEKGGLTDLLTAIECSSFDSFKEKFCMQCNDKARCVVLGPKSAELATELSTWTPGGRFFINTASKKPFFREKCLVTTLKFD